MRRFQERREGSPTCDLSVIIVNYNGARILPACIKAIGEAAGDLELEVIVVDNGSTDGSGDSARSWGPNVRVVRLGRNVGFGRANNIGAAQARGEYWLLLNSDCFVRPGLFQTLISALERWQQVAVVGPLLLNADGTIQPSCHNFPAPLTLFLEQFSLRKLLGRVPGLGSLREVASEQTGAPEQEVDWLLGACMLVRPQAYAEVGGFDPGFFFYWEETDLCIRLQQHGWKVLFEPAAQAVHLGGGSTAEVASRTQFFKSLYRFYSKHYSRRQLALARAIVRLMALLKMCREVPRLLAGLLPAKSTESQIDAWLDLKSWARVARL